MLFTSQGLVEGPAGSSIDDIIFPPGSNSWPVIKRALMSPEVTELLRQIAPAEMAAWGPSLLGSWVLLFKVYDREINFSRQEPPWFAQLPRVLQADFRHRQIIDEADPLAISFVPHSGVNYIVLEDGLIEELCRALKVFRLRNIRQLGFLHDPIFDDDLSGRLVLKDRFCHTRYAHSLDVMVLATLMGVNCGLGQDDLLHLRVAALTHDVMTPAGGDTIKFIDPAGLNEETNYYQLLVGPAWQKLETKHALSAERLIAIVKNQGVLGELLDLADKIAYVAFDSWVYQHRYDGLDVINCSGIFSGQKLIIDLLQRQPFICGLWDAVRVIDNRAVVTDALRLGDFLKLRALLCRHFYYHPGTRFEEATTATLAGYLYGTGQLTKDDLLEKTDDYLDRVMADFLELRHYNYPDVIIHPGLAQVEEFADQESARQREQELVELGNVFCCTEDFSRGFKTGANLLTQQDGQVMPLAEAQPRLAAELAELSRFSQPYRVYWTTELHLPPAKLKALQAWRREQFEKTHS
ncbi:MAG: HD domain-containing protein [Patescibacteria group bacterium]|jgi:hypothetical protein